MSKELSPLKTFELLCRYCVEEINILRHKQIDEDYFYNENYGVSITDKKTLEKGFTANIEKALKALEIIKEIDKTSLSFFIAICVKDQDKYDFLKEILL